MILTNKTIKQDNLCNTKSLKVTHSFIMSREIEKRKQKQRHTGFLQLNKILFVNSSSKYFYCKRDKKDGSSHRHALNSLVDVQICRETFYAGMGLKKI